MTDIASIVFICVTANHLGLIQAIEGVLGTRLYIVNCPKCFTFWMVLTYTTFTMHGMIPSLAISFLASYTAIWLELLEGYVDTLYMMLYEKIYPNDENHPSATDECCADTECTLS